MCVGWFSACVSLPSTRKYHRCKVFYRWLRRRPCVAPAQIANWRTRTLSRPALCAHSTRSLEAGLRFGLFTVVLPSCSFRFFFVCVSNPTLLAFCRTFQGVVCLMQLSTREKDYIVDPLKLRGEMSRLLPVFTDPGIVKVGYPLFCVNTRYHACMTVVVMYGVSSC